MTRVLPQVALLLETMIANLNTTLDDFHLIGFSLGAHVSGHAGARLKNLSRISGEWGSCSSSLLCMLGTPSTTTPQLFIRVFNTFTIFILYANLISFDFRQY